MKKIITAACTAAVAAIALPAFADHQIGGYYRDKFIAADTSFKKDGNKDPDKLIDQRLRARWQNNINEYITIVWFGEVDFFLGGPSKGAIGGGGQIGGDGVNVETKNAFASVKIPNTPLAVTVGLQNMNTADNLVLDDDGAGVQVSAKLNMMDVNLQYSKFSEGDTKAEDDVDFSGVEVGLKPMEGLNLGVAGYWKNDNATSADLYWVIANGGYKVGMLNLEAILGYNFGEESDEVDVSAGMLTLKAGASVAGFDAGVRFLYMGGDNDENDANYYHNAVGNGSGAGGRFSYGLFDGLMIFASDWAATSYAEDQYAYTKAGFTDHGLMAVVLNGKYVPPALKAMYAQVAVGYFAAVEDKTKRIAETEGATLGTEIAVRMGYKIAEKFDVSLNGATAILGDFFDAPAGGDDPDDPYKVYVMANIPY